MLQEKRLDRTNWIKSLENFDIIIQEDNIQIYKKAIRDPRKKWLRESKYKHEETKRWHKFKQLIRVKRKNLFDFDSESWHQTQGTSLKSNLNIWGNELYF